MLALALVNFWEDIPHCLIKEGWRLTSIWSRHTKYRYEIWTDVPSHTIFHFKRDRIIATSW